MQFHALFLVIRYYYTAVLVLLFNKGSAGVAPPPASPPRVPLPQQQSHDRIFSSVLPVPRRKKTRDQPARQTLVYRN